MKSAMLIQKCHGLMSGDEKFSFVISSKAAAASNPTTAGRKPINTLCTVGVCIYFINIRLISIISMSEGSTSATVATTLPGTGHATTETRIVGSSIATIGGRIDADRSWCHLTDSHDVSKFGRREPVMMHHRLGLYERQHAIAATKAEQSYLKEGKKKIQIYHSDVFISLPYKKPPTAAAMIMNTGFTCSR